MIDELKKNEYRLLLERLKRNKENVPMEILTTMYRKSYDRLKETLSSMTEEILQDIVLTGLQIELCHAEEKYVKINTAIRKSGILEKVSHAVFIEQDANQVDEYAIQLREIVHRIAEERE